MRRQSHHDGYHVAGLTRIHRSRGPEMRVLCPLCELASWVEYGHTVCRKCRRERTSGRRRGGYLLALLGTGIYSIPFWIHVPWWLQVFTLFVGVSLGIVGFKRVFVYWR